MDDLAKLLPTMIPTALTGSVLRTEGLATAVAGLPAPIGALVHIQRQAGEPLEGEVIGFRDNLTIVYPFGDVSGIRRGSKVRLAATSRQLRVGPQLLGRILDARGVPIDGRPATALARRLPLLRTPPPATDRPRIALPLGTGVRAVDGLLTCGKGQRIGIFSGSGVGKSMLLGMMARGTAADVNVIAMIGERGREVNEFIHRDLGSSGLARSVVVVATSDQPAILRVQAAQAATVIAEYFRDLGKDVLLMMDSLTRFAMAQREIGLAAGEPPTTRGYPPSVFAMMPRLVERAGMSAGGSITGFYTVLVEGDDSNEPISDAARGLLDGHFVLSRKLASKGHYPAIDVLASISRLMPNLVPAEQLTAATTIRELMGSFADHEDLISIGAYRAGANPTVDRAIAMRESIDEYLRQTLGEPSGLDDARQKLSRLVVASQARPTLTTPAAEPANKE